MGFPTALHNTSQTPGSWPSSWPVKPQGPPRPFVGFRRQAAWPAQPLRPSSRPSIPRTPPGVRMWPFGSPVWHCCLVASPLLSSAFSSLPSARKPLPEAVSSTRLDCLVQIFSCSFLLLARPPAPSCQPRHQLLGTLDREENHKGRVCKGACDTAPPT